MRRAESLPVLLGLATTLVGLVNLASALTPNVEWRGRLLLDTAPLETIPVFHALAVPAGAGLMVMGVYLARRRRRAWRVAIGLSLLLGAANLAKGLDFEEALLSWALAGVLWWARPAFCVRHDPMTLRAALWRTPLVAGLAVLVSAIAVAAGARPHPPPLTAVRESVHLLTWQSTSLRFDDELAHLPLGVGLIGLLALLAEAYLVFRPLAAPRDLPNRGERRRAQSLVRSYGADTLSFFKLRGDQHYLFSHDDRAFAGYRVHNGVMVVAGDPVGPADALPGLLARVVAFAEERGLRVAAVGAGAGLIEHWERAGLRSLYIGDEAIVDTERFSLEGRPIRKVRQSVARLDRAGYTAEMRALQDLDEATLAALHRVSDAWRCGTEERGFSMALDALGGEHQRDSLVVIARDGDGVVRGFLHFVPTFGRPALSMSFMRRERDTPNGLNEFLVVRSIAFARERGIEELSLNFAAFARLLYGPANRRERALGRLVALGEPLFQIESLYRFNAKFFPRWEPRYLIYESSLGLPRAGIAALLAEGQMPTPRAPVQRVRRPPARFT